MNTGGRAREKEGDRGRFSVSFFSNKKRNHRKDDSDFVEQDELNPNHQVSSSFFSLLLIAPVVLLWITDISFVVFPS